jgi:hypothetical protein
MPGLMVVPETMAAMVSSTWFLAFTRTWDGTGDVLAFAM